jgi:hypothetical protein
VGPDYFGPTASLLTAVLALSSLWIICALAFWLRRRGERVHLWFCLWFFCGAIFAGTRLAQMLHASDSSPVLLTRIVYGSAVGSVVLLGFARSFFGRPVRSSGFWLLCGLVAIDIVMSWIPGVTLDTAATIRTTAFQETFVGVRVGPAYPLFLSLRGILLLGLIVRTAYQARPWPPGGGLVFGGMIAGPMVGVNDSLLALLDLRGVRLLDFAFIPLGLGFSLAQIARFAGLMNDLEGRVGQKTAALAAETAERKQAEQEVRRGLIERQGLVDRIDSMARFEALGRLAGGVAHDFNNLLQVVVGNGQLAQNRLDAQHPARALVDDILLAGNSGADLTRQLLAFARRQPVSRRAWSWPSPCRPCTRCWCACLASTSTFVSSGSPANRRCESIPPSWSS